MNLYTALKSVFATNTAAASGARIPLMNDSGNVVANGTYEDVAKKLNAVFRYSKSKNTAPYLWKIWETPSGNGGERAVLMIAAYRTTTNEFYGMVELMVGRYCSSSANRDMTKVLDQNGRLPGLKLYKKINGKKYSYYVGIDSTNNNFTIQVSQILGTGGTLMLEESSDTGLTEITSA